MNKLKLFSILSIALVLSFQVEISFALTKCLKGSGTDPTKIPSASCSGKCIISKDSNGLYTSDCDATTTCTFSDFGPNKYCCTTDDCNKEILIKCFRGGPIAALTDALLDQDCKESEFCKIASTTSQSTTQYTGSCSSTRCSLSSTEYCCNEVKNCNTHIPKLPPSNNSNSFKNSFFGVSMLVSIVLSKLFTL